MLSGKVQGEESPCWDGICHQTPEKSQAGASHMELVSAHAPQMIGSSQMLALALFTPPKNPCSV